LREMPTLGLGLMKVMARRIRGLTDRAKDVSLLDVESRLAKVVLALAARFGDRTQPRRTTISLKLSQQELAGMVGATRELVNRRLRGWADSGIAEHVAGGLTIHDERALRSLAGGLERVDEAND
jgi:CRP/FNR family cyclic AMP-dependent transcriptional regulator